MPLYSLQRTICDIGCEHLQGTIYLSGSQNPVNCTHSYCLRSWYNECIQLVVLAADHQLSEGHLVFQAWTLFYARC